MSRLTLLVVIAALLVPASAQARVVGDPQPPAPTVGIGVALFGALLLGAASIAMGVRRTRTRAI